MNVADPSGTLAIFAKEPHPGRAKTRLIPALGAEAAARLSAAFLNDLLPRLAAGLAPQTRMLLCYDPPEAAAHFATRIHALHLHRRIDLLSQSPGDLGQRLAAVKSHVKAPVVFIGTDAPDLPIDFIITGLRYAQDGRAYLMKTADGGYALLALPAQAPSSVFENIVWSTSETARQQCDRIRAAGIDTRESELVWWDVDEPADLLPLRRRLEANPQLAPETLEALRLIGALPSERPPL